MIIQRMKATILATLLLIVPAAQAGILHSDKVLLLCHRTANRDLPENTLDSLALAARMGCDIVEIDVRRTADGVLVLNHDGLLDRFSDTTGQIENTDLSELDQMDFGSWMGERFRGLHLARFDDALRLAHELGIGLYLDIKTSGIGKQVLDALVKEGMTNQVVFGGEWDDVRQLDPGANEDQTASVQPGFTSNDVESLHKQHKIVIANFILNGHEFDLDGMKQAVAVGVNGIMVDYPRLGAEAVGRPVEKKIADLSRIAESGTPERRVQAIRALSGFVGLPLQPIFLHWLLTGEQATSHEAALALVTSRPRAFISSFEPAIHSSSTIARANAAWAVGMLAHTAPDAARCASMLTTLVHDGSNEVVKQTLVALSRCQSDPRHVPVRRLQMLLTGNSPVLRGLSAVALAKHHPEIATREVPAQLEKEIELSDVYNSRWTAQGRPKLTQQQIDKAVEIYRAQMKELHALELLPKSVALHGLEAQAFRPWHDYSMMPILVSGFKLWDRIADHPESALAALTAQDGTEADWAEWALVKAGPEVLPMIRRALPSSRGELRRRLIDILSWQADTSALPLLNSMEETETLDRERIRSAIARIQAFSPGESPIQPSALEIKTETRIASPKR